MNASAQLSAFTAIAPELILAVGAMALLMLGAFRGEQVANFADTAAIVILIAAGVFVALMPDGKPAALGGSFVIDDFARFLKIVAIIGAAATILMSFDFTKRHMRATFEYPVVILLSVTGMLMLISAADLIALYLGLELMSLSLYVLASFQRDQVRASEAGLKYFVLGALSSGMLLYGASLIYGFTGTVNFAGIAAEARHGSIGLVFGLVFLFAGLCFKISAVPFHMWTPDVYEGAPTPVTAFFGTAPKVAAIALILRVMVTPFGHLVAEWQLLIVLVSIASMLLGSLAAIGQTSIKRLMAYSSIGHMGYALIGLATGTQVGVRGVLIYMVVYVFMNLGTFACIIAMRRQGRAVEKISDLSGLAKSDPGLALAMAAFMFSMAGIPPLSGFFGKLYIFLAAVQGGMWTLAVIGVLTSVVGAYYYLRIVRVMYFDAPAAPFDPRPASLSFVAAATGLFTTFFFVFPAPFVGAAQAAAKVLFG